MLALEKYVVIISRVILQVVMKDYKSMIERRRYEEALGEIEILEATGAKVDPDADASINASEIGRRYVEHLVSEG